ncbi:MAG TPA: hypothetical protein PK867_10525 [Pirellulales bacterium]|nr:hypothetical protein [Pirellulales bacterium]
MAIASLGEIAAKAGHSAASTKPNPGAPGESVGWDQRACERRPTNIDDEDALTLQAT